MDKDALRSAVRRHCLELKDMLVGIDGTEPEEPEPLRLDFMDPFSVFQLAVYLEEELDVLLVEPLNKFEGETSDDLTDLVVQNHPNLLTRDEAAVD